MVASVARNFRFIFLDRQLRHQYGVSRAYFDDAPGLEVADHAVIAFTIALFEQRVAVTVAALGAFHRYGFQFGCICELSHELDLCGRIQVQPRNIAFLVERILEIAFKRERFVIVMTDYPYA